MEKMEVNRKRPGADKAGDVAGKRVRTHGTSEETTEKSSEVDEEVLAAWLSIDDATASEQLSKILETEAKTPVKVRFIDDPYSPTLIFQSSSSYITINGNEESCGSSFSDWDSSAMASVDTRGMNIGGYEVLSGWFPAVAEDGAWGFVGQAAHVSGAAAAKEEEDEGKTNGCDYFDLVDEKLARFLGEDIYEK